MNPFLAVIDTAGGSVGIDALTAALPALGQTDDRAEVHLSGSWGGAWVPAPDFGRPGITHRHGIVALGNVRLTDRRNLAPVAPGQPDLELVVDHYLRRGTAGIRDLIGDFAFVLWDTRTSTLVAARDALGVKSLFYQVRGSRIAVASHLDCFEPTAFDRAFIADFLVALPQGTDRTMFADVRRLMPGTVLVARDGRIDLDRYWSVEDFVPRDRADERTAIEQFRVLVEQAVAAQLDDRLPAWSQLSGGLDSSSVVAITEALAVRGVVPGLAGTETVVDSLSEGDETRYSDAVAARCGLRNEKIVDYWAWQRGAEDPPKYADPRPFLPFYTRDRAMRDAVRSRGGKVLLSGYGSDNLLAGNYSYFADWVRGGRWRDAAVGLTDLAIATRQSFYQMARRHVVAPLAPEWLARLIRPDVEVEVPGWLPRSVVEEFGLLERTARAHNRSGRGVFMATQVASIGMIDLALERGVFEEGIEMRYPFLHRPLVEFCLELPMTLRFRPNRSKWILREALGPLLPDSVRNRKGKGGIDGRVVWSLERERPLLEAMIRDSHLVELGMLSRPELEQGFTRARAGDTDSVSSLFAALSLETWFAVRSGWWKRHAPRALPVTSSPPILEQHHVEAQLQQADRH